MPRANSFPANGFLIGGTSVQYHPLHSMSQAWESMVCAGNIIALVTFCVTLVLSMCRVITLTFSRRPSYRGSSGSRLPAEQAPRWLKSIHKTKVLPVKGLLNRGMSKEGCHMVRCRSSGIRSILKLTAVHEMHARRGYIHRWL